MFKIAFYLGLPLVAVGFTHGFALDSYASQSM